MKKEYKTPELKKVEFSVADDILVGSVEDGFGGDDNNAKDTLGAKDPFQINHAGFGW